jgi:hypothetical protein
MALIITLAMSPLVAFAEGTAQITVGNSGTVQEGEEFTVPVNMQDNPGIAGATFAVHYNGNALELTNISGEGGILGSGIITSPEEGTVGYLTFPNLNRENGLLFNVTFKVKDGVETGDYEIAVGLKDNLDKNLVDGEAQTVPVNFTPGTVAISGVPPSDTGDGPGGVSNPSEDGPGATTPGTVTTGDGTEVTESVDVNAPTSSVPKQISVGTPFFVNAEEGSLSWDSDVLEGYYDANAGGYVLTPKKPGDTALTYRDENGNEKSIELAIEDAAAPLDANETEASATGAGANLLIPVLIIVALVIVAVVIFIMLRRKKSKSAAAATTGKHRPIQARR